MLLNLLAVGALIGGGLSALGAHQSGKKAEKAARQSAAQARRDYYLNYLPMIGAANAERRQGAGLLLSQIMNMARQGQDIPEEWLVEAERVLGPSFEAFADVVNAEMGAYKKGRIKEVEDKLKKFKGLPGGTELALKQQAMDEVTDAGIRAKAQGKVEHTKLNQEVNLANAQNALRAGEANLQARAGNRAAAMGAVASTMGPLASLLSPIVPPQMGQQGYFQGPVAASPLEGFGNAMTNSLMLYSLMGGGGAPTRTQIGSRPLQPLPGSPSGPGGIPTLPIFGR